MRPALPCPGAGLPVLPGNPALGALREFRERPLGCLTARGDALLELADAVLCPDRPVRSLVQLSLEPEFRRGHGALYDALEAGRIDDERLFSLLTEVLPRSWGHRGPRGRADGTRTRDWSLPCPFSPGRWHAHPVQSGLWMRRESQGCGFRAA